VLMRVCMVLPFHRASTTSISSPRRWLSDYDSRKAVMQQWV
jgi:hypothetical protein